MATCRFCTQRVEPTDRHVYQRVVGWEKSRSGGGTNAIALREVRQEWAHAYCVDRAKRGHLGQTGIG